MPDGISNLWGLLGDQSGAAPQQAAPTVMPGLLDPQAMERAGQQEGWMRVASALADGNRRRLVMQEGYGPGFGGSLAKAALGYAQGQREGRQGYMKDQQAQQQMARQASMQEALSDAPEDRLSGGGRQLRTALGTMTPAARAALQAMDPTQQAAFIGQLATKDSDPFRGVRFEGGNMIRATPNGGFETSPLPRQARELDPNHRYINVPGQGLVDTWALQRGQGGGAAPGGGGAPAQGNDPLAAYAEAVAGRESGGNPNARNPLSTATGSGQFLDGTWLDMWGKHGARMRPDMANLDPNRPEDRQRILALRNDRDLSLGMTRAYAQENAPLLRQAIGGEPTPTDLYLGHFLGGGRAPQFASLARTAPDTPADMAVPRDVLQANRGVFFRPDNTVRTVGEVYGTIDQDMRGRMQRGQVANMGQRQQQPGVVIPARDTEMADYEVPGVGVQRLNVAEAQRIGLTRPQSGGVNVQMGDNGQLRSLQVGGSAPPPGSAQPGQPGAITPTQPTANNLQERIVQHAERAGRLDDVISRFKPEYLRIGPQVANWGNAQLERLGFNLEPATRRQLTEYTQFRQSAFADMNDTLRAMSGLAVSDGEASRQLRVIGNADSDSPTEFQAKLRLTQEFTQLATARLHWMARQGLSPTPQNFEATPLSEIRSVINSRGEALRQGFAGQGVPEAEIAGRVRNALTQEFGIRPGGAR